MTGQRGPHQPASAGPAGSAAEPRPPVRQNVSRPWIIEDRIFVAGTWSSWGRVGSTYATHDAALDVVVGINRRDAGAAGPTRDIRIRHRDEAPA